ncbi:hypothetical protein EVG20_g2915 [Dentipellis fragilis]|uniref:Cyclase n=1 Tax=Dentipellis fragilis TaxID=205917 RepID=A0A4Y9Z7D0_9AGAM|nr:hypothetical protein EVG20_g2915 [Dentipellis fragilis]
MSHLLKHVAEHLRLSATREEKTLPSYDELPNFKNYPGCAWEVWGSKDQLGTVNLLTDAVVKRAAEEIKTGRAISLNWPIQFPSKPAFGRAIPEHKAWIKPGGAGVRDDELHINTQSGSQWDGLKHFPVVEHQVLYNNTPVESLPKGGLNFPDPSNIDPEVIKLGIHNWAQHGICGRGVLLDLVRFYTKNGKDLPYDPWTSHAIPLVDLEACAREQGVTFRRGDILVLRVGFIQKYFKTTLEEKDALRERTETL